jgi:hypothetical protein
MKPVTILQIDEKLQKLPQEKLAIVYDFIELLLKRTNQEYNLKNDSSYETMLASEEILKRDWNTIEEEEAWADL